MKNVETAVALVAIIRNHLFYFINFYLTDCRYF